MLRERKLAWEEAYPETAHGGDRKSLMAKVKIKSQTLRPDFGSRFSSDAVAKVGLSERTIQADIALAGALSSAALADLRRTDLVDNFAELRRFAAHEPADQVLLASKLAAGEARTVAQARVAAGIASPIERDAQDVLFNKLVELYGRANAKTKRRFEVHAGLVAAASRQDAA